jgi:tetratricopeptide (TPR) repeat protein
MATTKDGEDFLKALEIDSAIAVFTVLIDKTQKRSPQLSAKDYLYRGIARCFNPLKKDEKYADAISDLSAAAVLDPKNPKVLYYRAYAYYMSKIYDRAIDECTKVMSNPAVVDKEYFHELLGNSYFAKKDYPKAVENYREAIKVLLKSDKLIPPSLFDNYRKTCEKIREDE